MATRVDPYRGFKFLVEMDGITQAGFQECRGLDSSTDDVEYREGDRSEPYAQAHRAEQVQRRSRSSAASPIPTSCGSGGSDRRRRQGRAQERLGRAARSIGRREDPLELQQRVAVEVDRPGVQRDRQRIAIETLELTHEEITLMKRGPWGAGCPCCKPSSPSRSRSATSMRRATCTGKGPCAWRRRSTRSRRSRIRACRATRRICWSSCCRAW